MSGTIVAHHAVAKRQGAFEGSAVAGYDASNDADWTSERADTGRTPRGSATYVIDAITGETLITARSAGHGLFDPVGSRSDRRELGVTIGSGRRDQPAGTATTDRLYALRMPLEAAFAWTAPVDHDDLEDASGGR